MLECPVRHANSYYTIIPRFTILLKLVHYQAFYSKHLSVSATTVVFIHAHLLRVGRHVVFASLHSSLARANEVGGFTNRGDHVV